MVDQNSTESASAEELPKETIFEIIKNSRRREVLRYLDEAGGTSTIKELSRHIAAQEEGLSREDATKEEYKRVYVALHQTHLPKMDELGVVRYDRDDHTVKLLESAAPLFAYLYLDRDSATEPPVDLRETEDHLEVLVDLPGFDPAGVTIEASPEQLEVEAERTDDDAGLVVRERPTVLRREIHFPSEVYTDEVEASFERGVLSITFEKRVCNQRQPIEIQ